MEEVGHDLEQVEVLQRKFNEFQKTWPAKNSGCLMSATADKLTGEQHPEAQVITGKKAKLLEAWARLESLAMSRQQRLLGAHEIQRFNRDADETIVWITEKELWPDLLKATEK